MKTRIAWFWTLGLALAAGLVVAPVSSHAANIESGAWYSEAVDTDAMTDVYWYYAESNDTIIIRVANEDALRLEIPDVDLYYENRTTTPYTNQLLVAWSNNYEVVDFKVTITNLGWYKIYCSLPPALYTYTNALSYSVSMLRMPHAPLSYADLDVGPIRSGEYLEGTIDVGADLDAASFTVSNRCTVQ